MYELWSSAGYKVVTISALGVCMLREGASYLMMDVRPLNLEYWYAVHCKPFKEWLAAARLTEQLGLKVYVPKIKTHFRGQIQFAPFFPRYLFIQANLQRVSISQINSTPGVARLVTFDQQPQPIAASVIDALRRRMERLNSQGGLPSHTFYPGDDVRVVAGPLQGLAAVFVGPMKPSERVNILVDFLGCRRPAEVPVNTLERSAAQPGYRSERRTRGKGRHIKVKS
jgi:transcriptional antiterminator RfaH